MSYSLRLLWSLAKETFDAAAKVKECAGDRRADALNDEQTRAWIDISKGLAFECKAERNEKHQRDSKVSQSVSHTCPSGELYRLSTSSLGMKTQSVYKSFDNFVTDIRRRNPLALVYDY